MSMHSIILKTCLILCLSGLSPLMAQQSIGVRFGTHLNSFLRPAENNLIDSWYSTGVIGVFWSNHKTYSGFDLGINLIHKSASEDEGFPNLPVIMQDFDNDRNTGLTAIEAELRVGPRFKAFHPRIGIAAGYLLQAEGFQAQALNEINKFYLTLPFGLSVIFPTNFGTVSTGAFYRVGVTQVLEDPDTLQPGQEFNGGRARSFNIELALSFGAGARRR